MNILIVVPNFVPEIGSAAHLYHDFAKAFVKRGHDVDIITSYPRKFYLNKDDADRNFHREETIEGIRIHRCKHGSIRDNIVLRGMEHFLLPYYYFMTYRRLNKRFDVCLIYIPPLPLYFFASAIKWFDGTPSVLNYQDFHPQELIDVGLMKNTLFIKIMEYIERQSYRTADFITVLSEGGIDYVASRGGEISKIEHIYNGCLISDSIEFQKRKDFKEKERIEDKILVSYAGILSSFQGLDNILNAAKELIGHNEIIFYLVGDGLIKGHLTQRIRNENISNVKLLPLQPRNEYFNIINSSDISLISLDDRMTTPCIPGKLINLLAMKQPIIAIVPDDCETAKVIRKSKNGIVIPPGKCEELVNAILDTSINYKNRKNYGENGGLFVVENMDLNKNVKKYEHIFDIIRKNRRS